MLLFVTGERKAHQHQKPIRTWQKRRFVLKWQMRKTPRLLVSGEAPGSAFAWFFDNAWNDLHISYPTRCPCQVEWETNRKMKRSSNITEYQDATTGSNLRKKKVAISGYVNHGKNVSTPLFRIILNSRMISLPAPEWWLRKQKYSFHRHVQQMIWSFSAFRKIPGTLR